MDRQQDCFQQDADFFDKLASNVRVKNTDAEFAKTGFHIWCFDSQISSRLNAFFDPQRAIKFSVDDVNEGYRGSNLSDQIVDELNLAFTYFDKPGTNNAATATLELILQATKDHISQLIGFPFRVANVRAWETRPKLHQIGPTQFHRDGGPTTIKKIMIYTNPMNEENGTLEIYDRNGRLTRLTTQHPTMVLVDVSDLMHRGVPPTGSRPRPVIEVTICPHPIIRTECIFAGQNARWPKKYIIE